MKLVVGMSGASGAIYGLRLLEVLKKLDIETHLVMSDAAKRTIVYETDRRIEEVKELATHVHELADVGACISSGSFRHDGMVIAPCSIKTLSALAHSFNTNLLIRAADVTLKERRKLVLMVRETPLHLGHLEMMAQAARYGAVVLPPVPAFYNRPQTLDDIVNHCVGKALDQFGIDHRLMKRWKESDSDAGLLPRVAVA